MTSRLGVTLALAFLVGFVATTVRAQTTSDLVQIIGLFEGGCMRFTGNPAGLRNWAASRGLQPVPAPEASAFLGGFGAGRVFAASTASGRHAIVSYDDGLCQVVAPSANPVALQMRLRSRLNQQGIAVTPASGGVRGAQGAMQLSFHAWCGRRRWLIGIVSRPLARGAPELHLFAMLDPAPRAALSRTRP